MGQTEGLTGMVHPCTDVLPGGEETKADYNAVFPALTETGKMFYLQTQTCMFVLHRPCDQHGHIMMSWVSVALRVQVLLPNTETAQSCVCMVNDLQSFLRQQSIKVSFIDTFIYRSGD